MPATPHAENRECRLLALPAELLHQIVDDLDGNIAQVKLRATCKQLRKTVDRSITYRKNFLYAPNAGHANDAFQVALKRSQDMSHIFAPPYADFFICEFTSAFKNKFHVLNDDNRTILIRYGSGMKSLVDRARFVIGLAAFKADLRPETVSLLRKKLAPCRELSDAYHEAVAALDRSHEDEGPDLARREDPELNRRFDMQTAYLQSFRSGAEKDVYQRKMKDIISPFINFPEKLSVKNICQLRDFISQVKNFKHFTFFLKRLSLHSLPDAHLNPYIFQDKMTNFKFMHTVFADAENALRRIERHHERLPAACP